MNGAAAVPIVALVTRARQVPAIKGLERLFALALQAGRRARSWRKGPARSLADVARDASEGMTRHPADRLLREPLERLGRDADGRTGRAIRHVLAL